ncbi:hypothetical protein ACOMHN_011506 [Nucella lapillus]
MMGDALLCFSRCIDQPQPKRRRRLDPSMIGLPTDFRHTAHIGSGDVNNSHNLNTNHLHSVENQMSSKGDYEHHLAPGHLQISVVNLPQKSPS